MAAALDQLAVLKNSHPTLITREVNHPFTECATFADDIKSTYSFQASWHFVDQPYFDQGGTLADYPLFVPDTYDLLSALTNLTNWLEGTGDYMSTYYYQ